MNPGSDHEPFESWFAQLCALTGLSGRSHDGRMDFPAGTKNVVNCENHGAFTLKLPIDEQLALLDGYPDNVRLLGGWAK